MCILLLDVFKYQYDMRCVFAVSPSNVIFHFLFKGAECTISTCFQGKDGCTHHWSRSQYKFYRDSFVTLYIARCRSDSRYFGSMIEFLNRAWTTEVRYVLVY